MKIPGIVLRFALCICGMVHTLRIGTLIDMLLAIVIAIDLIRVLVGWCRVNN
jgi:hypothetical protein